MPHLIAKIDIHPTHVVLLYKRGDIIVLDDDMNVFSELGREDAEDQFLRSFSYPRTRCTFLPNDIPALGEILVQFLARQGATHVRVLLPAQGDGVTQIASMQLNSNMVSPIQSNATPVLKLCRQ